MNAAAMTSESAEPGAQLFGLDLRLLPPRVMYQDLRVRLCERGRYDAFHVFL